MRNTFVLIAALLLSCKGEDTQKTSPSSESPDLHWFIPDGVRADPDRGEAAIGGFQVFRWAEEGKLPNIRRMMETGAWGWSVPAFPSHTPANFASLLTGCLPAVHGIADGPMRLEGYPLIRPGISGFSSNARKVPAIWSILERPGRREVLLSIPGSTPPELRLGGITLRGRWGSWGIDLPSVVFERASEARQEEMAHASRLFYLGQDLTMFVDTAGTDLWSGVPSSAHPPLEVDLSMDGQPIYGLLVDDPVLSPNGYDRILISSDRKVILATLQAGEWSEWFPLKLVSGSSTVETQGRAGLVRIDDDGFFRLRLLVDGLHRFATEPGEAATELQADVGPMVDYVDSYPPQLVWYPEDHDAFLAEAHMSLDWHRRAISAIYRRYKPQIFIHDIYTPNQMLTSRWWMGSLDPSSRRYGDVSDGKRSELWGEVLSMYQDLDAILGEALAQADGHSVVVFSSDHGVAPLNDVVRLNNLFAQRGWLSTVPDPKTGRPVVDWANTRVVYLQMYHVYIRPDGLEGPWQRGSGPAYAALREEVAQAIEGLVDERGQHPAAQVVRWEDAKERLGLPADRVGDLVIANRPGFGWDEELTTDGKIFQVPIASGYKQAIPPDATTALRTPFLIVGPGIHPGFRIPEPIRNIDQLPTILRAMGEPVPAHVQGRIVQEIFEE